MAGEGSGPDVQGSNNDARENADGDQFSAETATQMYGHGDDAHDPIDEWRLLNSVQYTSDDHSDLTVAIVYAIAEARDIDPTDLNSLTLYECVDVSAIEEVFDLPSPSSDSTITGQVEFLYDGLRIVVTHGGLVMVYERAD